MCDVTGVVKFLVNGENPTLPLHSVALGDIKRRISSRGQTDRGCKKPDTNTDIRTPIFVSDNRNRIIEIAIR